MTRDRAVPAVTDAEIVAYLDGELPPADSVRFGQRLAVDPQLRGRLDHLMSGGRPFREAFEGILEQAPVDRLDGRLAAMLTEPPVPGHLPGTAMRHWRAIAAGLVVTIGLGAGLDRLVLLARTGVSGTVEAREDQDWRGHVAAYFALYTGDTLASLSDQAVETRIAQIGQKVKLDLAPLRAGMPAGSLRRADLYDYDGRPLVFMAYLDRRSSPLALCILDGAEGDEPVRAEQQQGFNVAYWSAGGHRFMLIGHDDGAELQTMAAGLQRVTGPLKG